MLHTCGYFVYYRHKQMEDAMLTIFAVALGAFIGIFVFPVLIPIFAIAALAVAMLVML